ncbi:MAG: Spore coat-like protein [Bacteroidetes bacterium]|nr:Spore coat-like protein [Bacteroidota bacterium]
MRNISLCVCSMRKTRLCVSSMFFSLLLLTAYERGWAVPADSLIVLTSSNLPIVVIDTHGREIRDEPKIPADMGIIDNGPGVRNALTDPFSGYQGRIGIETRGSSSEMYPKKQYAVETQDALGNDLDVSLLGMPAESDWVLSAPYGDKSLIRDVLLYNVSRDLGRYASRSRYCELVLNGEYRGVYILLEKIKRDKNRVGIAKIEPPDSAGDALTGGYIVKIDKTEGADIEGWYSGFPPFLGSAQRVYYQFHYPKPEDLVWPQRGYITRYIRDFELAMVLPTFNDPLKGYPALLDVGSFVDFVLLNEFSKNVDAYRLSCFMYKERDSNGGRLAMGPVWDYNLAFGNCNYHRASSVEGFQLCYMSDSLAFRKNETFFGPFWWKKIFDDPPMRRLLAERWTTLRSGSLSLSRITAVIDSLTGLLNESQRRNFIRWSILGQYVWPNAYVGQTYQNEIDYLKAWIAGRFNWLDREFTMTSVSGWGSAHEGPSGCTLVQNFPNPFNPSTSISYVVYTPGVVALNVYDLLGREVTRLVNEPQGAGTYSVVFDGSACASGTYVCRLSFAPDGSSAVGFSSHAITMTILR